ncbi:MAG: 2-dehydropantoate 2-reductase [Cytophagales bacterium]|nr:MAG: 2-dehydropantoate 2-reductase [Cytophagales bacterium]
MKIGIMGAGSIGCFLAAYLIKAGNEVVMVGRKYQQEALTQNGLRITTFKGEDFTINPNKISYATTPEALAQCSLILLTVKMGNTEEASLQIKQYASPNTIIISFQNGINNAEIIKNVFADVSNMHIWAGMVPYNVINKGNGHFHQGTSGELIFEQTPQAENIKQLLINAKLEAYTAPHMKNVLWGKLMLNLNNAVNALAGIPISEELNQPLYRKIVANAIKEGLKTLKKAKIKPQKLGKVRPNIIPYILLLPNGIFQRVAASMIKIDPQARSSMWEDLEKKRITEIDYLNGEIVKLAQQYQLKTPYNTAIVQLIKEAETKKQGSPKMTAKEIMQKIYSI